MDVPFLLRTLPKLWPPLQVTIAVSLVSLGLGFALGISLGVLRVAIADWLPVRLAIDAYVWLVRGTPIIVQIYAAFFLLPKIGIQLPLFWVGVVALTFNSVGYQIEIVRAAIASVSRGQREAARAIGMSEGMTLRSILLPQAVQRMIPPLTNELSNVVKASSVLSAIALFELHKASNAIAASTYKYVEVLLLQALLYFAVIQSLSWVARYLETRVFAFDGELAIEREQVAMVRA
ncbi:MAG: amino acid ABC transporter permease [Cyanobacteria bacterium J06648_11]